MSRLALMVLRDWDAFDFANRYLIPARHGACYLRSKIEGPKIAKVKAYRYPLPDDRHATRPRPDYYLYTLAAETIFGPVKEYKFVMSGEYLSVRVPDQCNPDCDVWVNIARMRRSGRDWDWFCHALS